MGYAMITNDHQAYTKLRCLLMFLYIDLYIRSVSASPVHNPLSEAS